MKKTQLLVFVGVLLLTGISYGNLLGVYFSGVNIDPNGILQTTGLTERFRRVDANIDFWDGSRYYTISGLGSNYTVEWTGLSISMNFR